MYPSIFIDGVQIYAGALFKRKVSCWDSLPLKRLVCASDGLKTDQLQCLLNRLQSLCNDDAVSFCMLFDSLS